MEKSKKHQRSTGTTSRKTQSPGTFPESEALYQNLFESAGDAIFLADDHRILDCNQKTLEIFGLRSKDDILGQSPWEFSPAMQPDGSPSRQKALKMIQAALRKGRHHFEWVHRRWDGRLFDAEVTLSPLIQGDKTFILAIVRDVTQRKQTEMTLLERERQLSLITDNLPAHVAYLDTDQIYRFVNRDYEKTFGLPRGQMIGRSAAEVIGKEDYALSEPRIRDALAGESQSFVDRFNLGGHGNRWLHVNYVPDRDESGRISGIFVLMFDISDMKNTENALRESEERFKRAAQAATDIIYEWDTSTDRLDWYGDIDALLGYDPGTFPRTLEAWVSRIHPDDLKKMEEAIERHRESTEGIAYEYRIRHREGHWLVWTDRATPVLDETGQPIRHVGAIRNVTEQKRAELKLQNNLKEKEVLLKEIHHRVKNNLQVISSLLRLQANTIDDAATADKFRISHDRIRTIALVHESLYQASDLAHIPFADYLRKLTTHLMASYPAIRKKVRLDLDIGDIPLDINQAIPCGLIINELLTNAIKHAFPGEAGGEIHIRMQQDEKERCLLSIRDTGIGLPRDLDVKQAETLGMQIVHDLAKQLNGRIEINRSGGTEFVIQFP